MSLNWRPERGLKRTAGILAGVLAIATGLAACNDYDPVRVPKAAGNTFDRFNFLSNVYPKTQRLVVSYEYVMVGQMVLPIPGVQEGQYWQFAEQSALAPDEFVGIHMAVLDESQIKVEEDPANEDALDDPLATEGSAEVGDPLADSEADDAGDLSVSDDTDPLAVDDGTTGQSDDGGFDTSLADAGKTIRLSNRSFTTYNYCVGPGQPDPGPIVNAYVDTILRLDYPLSDYLYVQRFRMKPDDEKDPARIDIVYVRDIVREGYTCQNIGDLQSPETEEQSELIKILETRSQRAFEIMS